MIYLRFNFLSNCPPCVFFKVPELWAVWADAMQTLLYLAGDQESGAPDQWRETVWKLQELVMPKVEPPKFDIEADLDKIDNIICGENSSATETLRNIAHFKLCKVIGKGAFGAVYLAQDVRSNYIVAIKAISKKEANKNKILYKEITCMHRCREQDNIIQLQGIFSNEKHVFLILEYCAGGSLRRTMKLTGRFTNKKSAQIVYKITHAIKHCHSNGVIHRDIKPENLLLGGDGHTIKLADFGCSVLLDPVSSNRESPNVGTPNYSAPEMQGKDHNKPADVWSIGVLLFEFLVGYRPFDLTSSQNVTVTDAKVLEGKYQFPDDIDKDAKHLITSMLRKNVSERISLDGILDHVFIRNNINKD
jgi:serine/threonine protein kinase